MTLAEVATLWEVSKGTVLRWAEKGDIPCVIMPGGRRRYDRAEIEADYINRCLSLPGKGPKQ